MANSLLKKISIAVSVIFSTVTAWFYVPKAVWFISSAIPPFYVTLQSWLNHPSIFLAINFIIFLIFRFSQKIDHHIHHYPHGGAADITLDKSKVEVDGVSSPIPVVDVNSSDEVVNKKKKVEFVGVSPPILDVPENSSDEVDYKKKEADPPPVDSGTASDASCVTTETEPDADEAQSSEENNDSMDATWHTIMANKDAPARPLKNSSSWERRLERTAVEAVVAPAPAPMPENKKEMKKSQTFKDGRRMPEALDEMDKQFDAFIQKNYDQMRRR